MKRIAAAGAAALLIAVGACQEAETEPPERNPAEAEAEATGPAAMVRTRQTHYKAIGKSMKAIGEQLDAPRPSVQEIRMEAAQIAEAAPQVLTWFPPGSGAETGLETRAKQEIWGDPQGFRRAAERFIQVSETFHDVTMTGDLAAIRAAREELGGACKNCHDDFRAPEE